MSSDILKTKFSGENLKRYVDVCLGGLFHDVGKFYQRAGKDTKSRTGKPMSHDSSEILARIFRTSEVGELFANYNFIQYIQKTSSNQSVDTIEAKCVRLGDYISAQERYPAEKGLYKPKETYLKAICTTLKINGSKSDEKYHPIKELSLQLPDFTNGESFYVEQSQGKNIYESQLFDKFLLELAKIGRNQKEFVDDWEHNRYLIRKVLDIIKRYLSYIPSATYYSLPDVDLYTHSKLAAAISSCLYYRYILNESFKDEINSLFKENREFFDSISSTEKQKSENSRDIITKLKDGEYPHLTKDYFILVDGDFSGIQNFISQVSSSRALTFLKNHSTYIMLLNEVIPIYIVSRLYIPETNIIFSGGGHFSILLPNHPVVINELKEIVDEINSKFYDLFGLSLFLSIKYKPYAPIDFHRFYYSKEEKSTEKIIIADKQKKWDHILDKIFGENHDQINDFCRICHKGIYNPDPNTSTLVLCNSCKEMDKLKISLKGVYNNVDKKLRIQNLEIFSLGDRLTRYFCYSYRLNDRRCQEYVHLNTVNSPFTFLALGYPMGDDGNIIEFDDIHKQLKERCGHHKLAAVKMDVDNLGKIFRSIGGANEFKRSQMKTSEEDNNNEDDNYMNYAFSHYARLSSDFSMFFNGYVESLRKKEEYKNDVYIVYSGGDDTFIIGAWDKITSYLFEFIRYFRAYFDNPGITISGAYREFHVKYPVKKVYEFLEKDLETTKGVEGKSSISIFGIPIKWGRKTKYMFMDPERMDAKELLNALFEMINSDEFDEFTFMYFYFNLLNKLVNNRLISRSYLQNVLDILEISWDEADESYNIRGLWLIHYYLVRIKKESNEEYVKELDKLWSKIYELYVREDSAKGSSTTIIDIVKVSHKLALNKTKPVGGDKE